MMYVKLGLIEMSDFAKTIEFKIVLVELNKLVPAKTMSLLKALKQNNKVNFIVIDEINKILR